MNSNVVYIPYVNKEHKIGSVLYSMFNLVNMTESCGDNVCWDYSNTKFLHPFFIAPLGIYRDNCQKDILERNVPANIQGYLAAAKVSSPILFDDCADIRTMLEPYKNKTYTPLCKFRISSSRLDDMQTAIQESIMHQIDRLGTKLEPNVRTAISYLLGELVCNMQEHSEAAYGYLYSQYLPSENVLYIALADNGCTIYGSYIRTAHKEYLDMIAGSEAMAIRLSTEGKSTKSYMTGLRGYGISTNSEMIVNGLNGSFLILSGGAFHRRERTENVFVNLPESIHWDGTLVLVKVPLVSTSKFDVYNYIQ